MEGESEVAKLREQIDEEISAMKQELEGLAMTAKHEIIHHKYDYLGELTDKLAIKLGEKEATEYICNAYIQIIG